MESSIIAIVGYFITMMTLFFLIFGSFFYFFIYFLASSPNRILSSIFSFKLWGAKILLLIIPVGMLLNESLDAMGMNEGREYSLDNDMARGGLVAFILGLVLCGFIKLFWEKSIFDIEKDEKKNPKLFVSQLFHTVLGTAFIVLFLVLIGYVLNYFLSFMLYEEIEEGASLYYNITPEIRAPFSEFFSLTIALLVPTLVLGMMNIPAFFQKKRFLPMIKSDAKAIFAIIAYSIALTVFLGVLGTLIYETLYAGLEEGLEANLNTVRGMIVALIVSGVALAVTHFKAGRCPAFLVKD